MADRNDFLFVLICLIGTSAVRCGLSIWWIDRFGACSQTGLVLCSVGRLFGRSYNRRVGRRIIACLVDGDRKVIWEPDSFFVCLKRSTMDCRRYSGTAGQIDGGFLFNSFAGGSIGSVGRKVVWSLVRMLMS